jgi:hypothetical protein
MDGGKKLLTCFLNSSGSVESSTSDPTTNLTARPNLLLVREEEEELEDEEEEERRRRQPSFKRNGTTKSSRRASARAAAAAAPRVDRYGSCMTEVEEQTWTGQMAMGLGENDEAEEGDENI